eukprot:g15885.t1
MAAHMREKGEHFAIRGGQDFQLVKVDEKEKNFRDFLLKTAKALPDCLPRYGWDGRKMLPTYCGGRQIARSEERTPAPPPPPPKPKPKPKPPLIPKNTTEAWLALDAARVDGAAEDREHAGIVAAAKEVIQDGRRSAEERAQGYVYATEEEDQLA